MINLTVLMDTYQAVKDYATWANEVYARGIPEEHSGIENKTVILVRDAYSQVSLFGSNTFNVLISNVVIQIFYSLENDLDYDEVEIDLMKHLETKGYRITDIKGRFDDPDTHQDYQTIQVTYTKKVGK